MSTNSTSPRDLPELHVKAKEIEAILKREDIEISYARQTLMEKMEMIQDLRCLTSIRSGFFLRMTMHNVSSWVKLPFMIPGELVTFKSINEINEVSAYRSDIIRLLNSIMKSMHLLPTILSRLSSDQLVFSCPFLPQGVEPRDFLACSALPSIFGYLPSNELRISYIDFLNNIAKFLPATVFNNFRSHWLFDCYKNYIHSSNMSKYLRLSLGNVLMKLLKDPDVTAYIQSNNQSLLFDRMAFYCEQIIQQMRDLISLIPHDVRYLLSSFSDLSEDGAKLQRIEILFLDCILVPAISLPKTYCVLPPTFYFSIQSNSNSRALQVLAQQFRLILHPAHAQLRHSEFNHKLLTTLPFEKLLLEIATPSEPMMNTFSHSTVVSLLSKPFISFLFSIPDVFLLAKVLSIACSPDSTPENALINITKKIPYDTVQPFSFFRFECTEISSFFSEKPQLKQAVLDTNQDTPLNRFAHSLFMFLRSSQLLSNPPSDLGPFLSAYQDYSLHSEDYITNTYLNHLILRLKQVPIQQYMLIMDSVYDIIHNHRVLISKNEQFLSLFATTIQQMHQEIRQIEEKSSELEPILYSHLMDSFLGANPGIIVSIKEKKPLMLKDRSVFQSIFEQHLISLKAFINPIAPFALKGVSSHFHSWIMQFMLLSEFISINPSYGRLDELFQSVSTRIVSAICIDPSAPKLKKIFKSPPLFIFSQNELHSAMVNEIPLEAARYLASAVELINRIFELEIGGSPQADELTPLINYMLLTSGLSKMYSFAKYLEHFLHEIPVLDIKFITDRINISVTHFVNHVTALDKIIETL